MQVRDGMSSVVLTVGPGHTLRQAAAQMAERRVGAAVVIDPELPGRGSSPSATSCNRSPPAQDPDDRARRRIT